MSEKTLNVKIKNRVDTSTNWTATNPVLLSGEMGIESDSLKFKFGDGISGWNILAYASAEAGSFPVYSCTSSGSVGYHRIATIPITSQFKQVMLRVKAYTASGTNSESTILLNLANTVATYASGEVGMLLSNAHSYNSTSSAENGWVFYAVRISVDSNNAYLDIHINKNSVCTIETQPLTLNDWTWSTGSLTVNPTAGVLKNWSQNTYSGVCGINLRANYSDYALYCSYGANGTISSPNDSTNKTGKWAYLGYVNLDYNSSYLGAKSLKVPVELLELDPSGTLSPETLEIMRLTLGVDLIACANSTAFNSAVPSLSLELSGKTSLSPNDFAFLVYSTSTSQKLIRVYAKLKGANALYMVNPQSRYGRAFATSSGMLGLSGLIAFNTVDQQAVADVLPAPAQGSVVFATKIDKNVQAIEALTGTSGILKKVADGSWTLTDSADKLSASRTISLTGDVTGSVSTDLSGNVSIATTVADDSHNHIIGNVDNLQSALDASVPPLNVVRGNLGNPSVTEMALIHGQFTNKLRFIPAILQEESTDGSAWTTSTKLTDNQLKDLMIGEGQATSYLTVIPAPTVGVPGGYYRLTFDCSVCGYVYLNAFYCYGGTAGNTITVTIEKRLATTQAWSTVASGNANGWPLHIYLPHNNIAFGPQTDGSHYDQVRVTFHISTSNQANSFTLGAIEWFGGYPAGKRNVESYDRDKNVTFPAKITGTQLVSSIASGTAPLIINSPTKVANLNADKLDDLDSTQFLRKDADNSGVSGGLAFDTTSCLRKIRAVGTNIDWGLFLSSTGLGLYDWKNDHSVISYTASSDTIVSAPSWTFSLAPSAPSFISTAPTGTAPFSVASTTLVANLNADLFDGHNSDYFAVADHSHTKADISDFPTLSAVATSGSYADLSNKPASLPASDVYAWAKASVKPTYTASEVGASATGHKHVMSDLTNYSAPTLTGWGVTASVGEINIMDGVLSTTAEINYLQGVTSNIQSQLNGKASSTHGHTKADISDFPTLATVATSGSYNDLSDKPATVTAPILTYW